MLRPAQESDAAAISDWLCEPSNNRWLTSNLRGRGLTPQLVQVALRRKDLAWFVYGDLSSDRIFGLVALDSIDTIDGVANLWFVLGDPSMARKGLTGSAIRHFCDDNPIGLSVAIAWAMETNVASQRTLVAAGFKEVGRIPDAVSLPTGRCARVMYARPFGTSS